MIIDIQKNIELFNKKYNKKIDSKIRTEILEFLNIKKHEDNITIDSIAFEYVRIKKNLSFKLLLQIKSSISFLKEKLISTLNESGKIKLGNISVALEQQSKSKIKMIVMASKRKNDIDLFAEDEKYLQNSSFIQFLLKTLENKFSAGIVVDFFGLFLIQKNKVINSMLAVEEFNNYE